MNISINTANTWTFEEVRNCITQTMLNAKHPCVLSFRTANVNKKTGILVQYAKCKYAMHLQKFKFIIMPNNIMQFFTFGPDKDTHGEFKEFIQLRGNRRIQLQNELDYLRAHNLKLKQLDGIDKQLLEKGNTQNIVLPINLRKARSERRLQNDLVIGCEILDATQRMYNEGTDHYIFQVTLPFQMTLIRDLPFEFLNTKNIIVHVDATGSLVRNPKCCADHNYPKKFYYACVVKINGVVFPIAELISCKHNMLALNQFFDCFNDRLTRNSLKIYKPRVYVSDWSWVFINSILKQLNRMTIKEYLFFSYKIILGEALPQNKVGIFICCSHFAAILIRQIKNKMPKCNRQLKDTFMIIMFLIIDARTIEEVDEYFEILCYLCCSKTENSIFHISKILLNNKIQEKTKTIGDSNGRSHLADISTEIDIDNEQTNLNDSPFFKRYNEILQNVVVKINQCDVGKQNILNCSEFIIFCTKKYMQFLPLWATIFLKKFGIKNRLSNAIVESWFNLLKNNLIKERHLKLGHFIDLIRDKTYLTLKSAELAPYLKPKKRKQKKQNASSLVNTPNLIRDDEKSPK